MRVEQFEVKNQFIIFSNDVIYFQSYDSLIAKIENDGYKKQKLIVYKNLYKYSKTTAKYFYKFLYDYFYDISKLIENQTNKQKSFEKLINTSWLDEGCLIEVVKED